MIRPLTNTCFGLAFGTAVLSKCFFLREDTGWLAIFCVLLPIILNLIPLSGPSMIWAYPLKLSGIGGLSWIYAYMDKHNTAGVFLILLTTSLCTTAILLSSTKILSHKYQGGVKQHDL